MNTDGQASAKWFLKTPQEAVYGPVDLATLCGWAADARIGPGCRVSADAHDWQPVESLAALRMDWLIDQGDSTSFGPINLLAVWDLVLDGTVTPGTRLVNRRTQTAAEVNDGLRQLVLQEARAMVGEAVRQPAEALAFWQTEVQRLHEESTRISTVVTALEAERQRIEQERLKQAELLERERQLAADIAAQHRALQEESRERMQRAEALGQEQAERLRAQAEETQRIRLELEQAQTDLAREQADHASARVAAAQEIEALAARAVETEQARAEANQARADVAQARLETEQVRADVEQARADLERERAAHGATRAADAEQLAALAARAAEVEGALADARGQVEQQSGLLREREAQIQALNENAARQAADFRAALEGREQERSEQRKTLMALKEDLERERKARLEARARYEDKLSQDYGQRIAELERAKAGLLQSLEAATRERDAASNPELDRLAAQRDEAVRRAADHEARAAELENELHNASLDLTQARQACEAARTQGQAAEASLQEKIAALQAELDAALGRCDSEGPRPAKRATAAPIDWVDLGRRPRAATPRREPSWETSGPELVRQVDQLKQELQVSTDTRERVAQQLEDYRLLNEALKQESDGKEHELQSRIEQLRHELEGASGSLQQTLQELEQRESNLRILRKKAEHREKELAERIDELEQRQGKESAPKVEEADGVFSGETVREDGEQRGRTGPEPGRRPRNVLATVEAQVQSELAKLCNLNSVRGKQSGKGRAWFWRKKS